MNDITPLEQGLMEPSHTEPVSLAAPRPVYRLFQGARADISFLLKSVPKSPVEIEILDAKGALVNRLPTPPNPHQGLNRVAWDLRYQAPRAVALRTTPPENPHIWEEPRFRNQDTRPITHWGLAEAEVGPIAAPGDYTLKLTVDGQSFTQPLRILLPPASHGTEADIQASVRLQLKVRDDITTAANMTNQVEWLRKQLADDEKTVAGKTELITRADALSDDKYFQTADKLYLNLIWLNGEIGTGGGDVAGTADYGPTETAVGLVLGLEKELQGVQEQYKSVMEKDVPEYNRSIGGTGLKPLKTGDAPPPPAGSGG
jgi:hypothetical protein